MSRYLRRLLARTAGLPLHALQPAPPLRWSSLAADPLVAHEAAVPQGAAFPTATTPGAAVEGLGPPQVELARAASVSGRTDSAAFAEESRDARHLARPRAQRAFDRSLIPDDHAPVRPAQIPTVSDNRIESDASQPMRVELAPAAGKPSAEATPDPVRPRTESRGRKQGARREPGERPSAVTLQPALTPRHEPTSMPPPDQPPRAGSTADRDAGRASVVLSPPPARAPEAPLRRAEIVIGRISVVIDSARPSTPAPRAAPRPAAGSARPADSGAEVVHHFGLGQL